MLYREVCLCLSNAHTTIGSTHVCKDQDCGARAIGCLFTCDTRLMAAHQSRPVVSRSLLDAIGESGPLSTVLEFLCNEYIQVGGMG